MQLGELVWTNHFLILDLGIIPLETVEVVASCLQDWVVESIAVTILVRILRINHPSSTARKSGSFLRFSFRAGITLRVLRHIEARCSNIEMDLVVCTSSIARRAKVSTLQYQCCRRRSNGRITSDLPAFTTARAHPISSSQSL